MKPGREWVVKVNTSLQQQLINYRLILDQLRCIKMIILPTWLITTAMEKPLENWGLRIVNEKVAEILPNPVLREKYPSDEIWEAAGQIAAPGFVDAHTHLYGILAHGIPFTKSPSGFMPFLEEFWWPLVENRLNSEMISAATDFNCSSMLHSGITSFYDCEEAPNALPGLLRMQKDIVQKWGIRGILSFEATQRVNAKERAARIAGKFRFY